MSDQDWPKVGPGTSVYSGPGPTGPGPRRPRKRPAEERYKLWLEIMEPATFGKPITVTINRSVFNKHVKEMKDHVEGRNIDDVLPRAWQIFAADVKAGTVRTKGKNAWFAFYARRAKYLDMALDLARREATDDGRVASDDEGWI